MRWLVLASLAFSFALRRVDSWSGTGHMLIAQIAELNLVSSPKVDCAELFVEAAPWFDDIKAVTHVFDQWHYMDDDQSWLERFMNLRVPYHRLAVHSLGDHSGRINTTFRSRSAVFRAASASAVGAPNVVFAISGLQKALHSEVPLIHSFAQCALIHLVGDIHQPLHCIGHGDRGGNDFHLHGPHKNLHALWDDGLGFFRHTLERPLSQESLDYLRTTAGAIMDAFPLQQLQHPQSADPSAWAKESHTIAVENVYRGISMNEAPSDAYLKNNEAVVKRQLATAGYRLAAMFANVVA